MNLRVSLALLLAFSLLISERTILRAEDAAKPEDKMKDLLTEAQSLQTRKRFLDALAKLEEAEALDGKRPEIYNIRGSIYLSSQARDISKARDQFVKACELQPEAMPPRFNLAETDFVGAKWPETEKGFSELLTKFPKLPVAVRHLVQFKVLLAQAKQAKFAEAEKMLADSFSFMDDTPAYYFAKSVIALEKKDAKTGNDWLTKAQIIFKPNDTSAYIDSMMEAKYIDSLSVAKPENEAPAETVAKPEIVTKPESVGK